MDVLELPRPVINFLRTMAKEGCRYVLSWDIFGGTDAVTLTLTWKLNDEQSQFPTTKSSQELIYDDLHIRHNDSISSPRRSRRDELISKPTILRTSRGKSLEENHLSSTKQVASHSTQISSLERSSIIPRQKKEIDPVYANISSVKYSTNPSPSFSLNNHRQVKQHCETPILRKPNLSTPIYNDTSTRVRRKFQTTARIDLDDDDDDALDPWVKRFDCSLENNTNDSHYKTEDDNDRTGTTPGKVKFKRTPDYF